MTPTWMSEAHVYDLHHSRGNGPFSRFLGVILHVNVDRNGTPDSFWRNNSGQVTPNFQVYKSEAAGGIHQMLPFNWQPWCQINGNFNYAAIETAGYPDEPLTNYQLHAIARILRVYRAHMGMKLVLADRPGERGLGTHKMGGSGWGGHACPGTIRTKQRSAILTLASTSHGGVKHPSPAPKPPAVKGKLRRAWPHYMPDGHYFGDQDGPNASHGGYYSRERPDVTAIQREFKRRGIDPGFIDGRWDPPTTRACIAWHRKYMPNAKRHDVITEAAWRVLFTR